MVSVSVWPLRVLHILVLYVCKYGYLIWVSGETSPRKDIENTFSNFQFFYNQFLYFENPTHCIGAWKLQCAQFLQNRFYLGRHFCSLSTLVPLDKFVPCAKQGYLRPKNQNYLLGKAELGFLLRTTIKITIELSGESRDYA